MTGLIGSFSLCGAVLAAALALLSCLLAGRRGDRVWLGRARAGLLAGALLLCGAAAALLVALINLDLNFAYVASHTERSLAAPFRMAAFWSGQEGSLLLWSWLLAVVTAVVALARRRLSGLAEAGTLGTLAAVGLFFAALMLFAANPFARVAGPAPLDGHGMNPQLQHWAMVAHPPMLFMGYAGFVVPFAIMLGALISGRAGNAWVTEARRWVIGAWLFLTAGIALGAWWAYVELGWGGYWAWDPVENASLLPWLTSTALVHSIIVHEHRGMLKGWTAALAALTFILCIFGTYLTRSGVIQSVHAFAESLIGTFFLAFLVVIVAASTAILVCRRSLLRPDHPMERLVGREGMCLVGNVLFLVMTATTLVGTIFPLISGLFTDQPVSVGPAFYNRVVAPMGLLLAAVMGLAPLLVYGIAAAGSLRKGLLLPAGVTVLVVGVGAAAGLRNPSALACLAIAVLAIMSMATTFVRAMRTQVRSAGTGVLAAAARLIDSNHRRYGGQLAHLGIVLVILGVAGSSLYSVKEIVKLAPGQTARVGRYTLRYDSLREVRRANYTAVQADVALIAASGREHTLAPQRRFYDKAENAASEVCIRSGFREDLYVVLAGWEANGSRVAVQVLINPLTAWIWIGTVVVVLGGSFSLVPRLARRTCRAARGGAAVVPGPPLLPVPVAVAMPRLQEVPT